MENLDLIFQDFSSNNKLNQIDKNKFWIFLDRDGTIIRNIPYLNKLSEVSFFLDLKDALEFVNEKINIIVVTNQSGIGRNLVTHEEVQNINKYIKKIYAKSGIRLVGFIYCPHTPQANCNCRKPKAEMINFALKKFNINKNYVLMIGDSSVDFEAAEISGIKFYEVNSNRKYDSNIKKFLSQELNN